MRDDYHFESFLPYFQALQLGRGTCGLLKLERGLRRGCTAFDETLVSGTAANIRGLFPDIRPPELSEEEFQRTKRREERAKSMTEAEMDAHVEELAKELREAIESGQIDIWDDSPRFLSADKVIEFRDIALARLNDSMIPSLKAGAGLLGDLVREGAESIKSGSLTRISALRAGLIAWDFARMHHEGEPPYKIVFSHQVAEALGIDPTMEKVRGSEMPRPTQRDRDRMEAAVATLGRGAPEFLSPLRESLRRAGVL